MLLNIFYILLGFVLLVKGGDFLVDGAVAIAKKAKLSPMVIGLTVIGFGTSTPELLVSSQAAIAGSSGIAIGNVVGSNIANVALILGFTSLVCPLPAKRTTLLTDMPFMLLSIVLFDLVAYPGTITRWEGIIGVLLLVGFVTWQIRRSRKHNKVEECAADESVSKEKVMNVWLAFLVCIVSIGAMVFGSDRLIEGASGIAMDLGSQLGVDKDTMERLIGLTIVAVGTSLPELFASVMAARKGERDMAVGNIIGSVTFNILSVVGISAAICPIPNAMTGFELNYILMTFLGFLLWLFLRTHRCIVRWEGAILLCCYILFLASTIVEAF